MTRASAAELAPAEAPAALLDTLSPLLEALG
jgi:hypothetical protein